MRILGDTPSFRGVKKRDYDTPIVVAKPKSKVDIVNSRQIRAEISEVPSNIVHSITQGDKA